MKEIQLSQGQVALVDDKDYEYLNQFQWYAHRPLWSKEYYVFRKSRLPNKDICSILMGRDVLRLGFDMAHQVNYINSNGLDNRKDNLKICACAKEQYQTLTPKKGISESSNIFLDNFHNLLEIRKEYITAIKTCETNIEICDKEIYKNTFNSPVHKKAVNAKYRWVITLTRAKKLLKEFEDMFTHLESPV